MLASHGVLIPPPGRGILIPNEENQVSSGCSVRNTTAQNIHFVKPPPMANTVPPSRRRVTPASTAEAAKNQRPKPRPVSQETTAPKTAPPAPTGAITLPTQLMKFRNAPSGCAPVCP